MAVFHTDIRLDPTACFAESLLRQLVAADRLRFHQLADEHDRRGFEPASSLSVNAGLRSLFPGCSPSIPITNVAGGPGSGRGRQPPQELGLGSRQNHGLGLESGGDNGSRQRKKKLPVLARLFAELRKVRPWGWQTTIG